MSGLRERKYLALLAVLLIAAIVEPLATDWSERTRIVTGVIVAVVNLGVLLVVFDQRWERWLALFLVIPVLASNIVHETFSNWAQSAAIVYHCFASVFLGFAVAVILKRIFHQETIRTDTVIGALCGYLLAAGTWGNAYALIHLLRPDSFWVTDGIAGRLGDWYLERFYFNYFSVTTLTSLGYGDITPIGTLALSLSWLEVVFGQFYIAVVVAQLVGLRLAESIRRERRDSN
jgi:Ion channel